MEQLSLYPDYIGVSHWHDDVEFIMMMDGQMTYDINGQSMTCRPGKVSLSTADACTMDIQIHMHIWSRSPAIPDILTRSLLPPFYGIT
ncbi:hypothetical protein [Coprococcus eutactus]|uniref:hypothetical protein n=1 Tax=Coprococcus eutactus TaxID=33043 RepID=UPI003219067F